MHVVAEVKQSTPFIPQQPRAVVENMFAVFARKDMVALREAFAPDVTFLFQGSVYGREQSVVHTRGFEGLVEFFQGADAKLQVQEFKPETIIADGTHVVAIGHESGIEIASGAPFRVHFVQHFEIANGRIARMTEYRVWITQESPRTNDASGVRLPAAPKEVQPYFRDTFNAGDLDALMRMYADKAVFVPTPGMALDQPEAIREATADFMGLKLPFAMTPRHLYVSGDTALMISDWVLEGTGPDGKPMKLMGTTADVAREQGDGTWRVIIDNPFGTA